MTDSDPRVQVMLAEIRAEARLAARYPAAAAISEPVLAAMARVPRHRFVPAYLQSRAYFNSPLPIGHGQTISQPYIVALMTDLLAVGPAAVVLEVGTGCGYQSAVLAEQVAQVYTIERVEPLAREAAARLRELGYTNVATRAGDGWAGWPEHAPYDGIIVTAGAPQVPPPLIAQLKPGARLVIPVERGLGQELLVVERQADGGALERPVLPVAFVPLVRGVGPWSSFRQPPKRRDR